MIVVEHPLRWFALVTFLIATDSLCATETILDSAKMPNRIFPQSEIQFIAADSGVIVRSIIDTSFPKKVFSKISQSEHRNWGKDSDMILYVETLQDAFTEYNKRKKEHTDQPLIVDFIAGSQGDKVTFYFGSTIWKELELSSIYIRKNQENILEDVFGNDASQKVEELRSLLNSEQ